jgi:hypothetical protein
MIAVAAIIIEPANKKRFMSPLSGPQGPHYV